MKKLLSFLLLITFMFSLFSFVGCDENNESIKDDPYKVTGKDVFDDGCYILGDFETYGEVTQFLFANSFGKVIMNTDATYVTRGKQSVRLEITGTEYWTGDSEQPLIILNTENRYFYKRDFSDCDYFAFDIFNVLDYDIEIAFLPSSANIKKLITCKPGWNNVKLDLKEEYVSNEETGKKDYVFGDTSLITSFKFYFDRGEKHTEQQVFYLDNFRAHKTTE